MGAISIAGVIAVMGLIDDPNAIIEGSIVYKGLVIGGRLADLAQDQRQRLGGVGEAGVTKRADRCSTPDQPDATICARSLGRTWFTSACVDGVADPMGCAFERVRHNIDTVVRLPTWPVPGMVAPEKG